MKAAIIIFILFLCSTSSFAQNLEAKLGTAANKGDLKTVKKLVEKNGADVNCTLTINGAIQIPLIVKTVMEHQTSVATYLIEQGADVNAKDGFGMTSLMWASYNGDVNLVKLLLEKGADKNATTKTGQTALKAAEENGNAEIINLLK